MGNLKSPGTQTIRNLINNDPILTYVYIIVIYKFHMFIVALISFLISSLKSLILLPSLLILECCSFYDLFNKFATISFCTLNPLLIFIYCFGVEYFCVLPISIDASCSFPSLKKIFALTFGV